MLVFLLSMSDPVVNMVGFSMVSTETNTYNVIVCQQNQFCGRIYCCSIWPTERLLVFHNYSSISLVSFPLMMVLTMLILTLVVCFLIQFLSYILRYMFLVGVITRAIAIAADLAVLGLILWRTVHIFKADEQVRANNKLTTTIAYSGMNSHLVCSFGEDDLSFSIGSTQFWYVLHLGVFTSLTEML